MAPRKRMPTTTRARTHSMEWPPELLNHVLRFYYRKQIERRGGTTMYYEGPLGEERMVRKTVEDAWGRHVGLYGDGGHVTKYFYEGPRGEERKVRSESGDYTSYFEGPALKERKVRFEHKGVAI